MAENADFVLGVKVRMCENVIARHGLEPLKRAIAACEKAGTGAKVMCHIGGVETRELMSQILDLLRPGDMLTHCYSGAPNIAGAFTNIVQDGKLLPAALAAKQRGVVFDVGHGGGSFDYTIAEAAIAAGLPARHDLVRHPRVLGQHAGHAVPALGDEQVHGPRLHARAGGRDGHRQPGPGDRPRAEARHAAGRRAGRRRIIELVEGPVSFVDTRNNKRDGKAYLKPVQTVAAGVPFGRPYNAPFAVR